MPTVKFNTALIVGAGAGLSAALARVLTTEGIKVALAARSTGDLEGLAKEIGAPTFACDASKRADVENCSPISTARSARPRSSSTIRAIARGGRLPSSIQPKSRRP
jgi:NADP-dependent 3-hydroxy acid dehydrogenase YdfG